MNFEDVFNNYLDILNCSSKNLAERSNLTSSQISKYRNGHRTPKADGEHLQKLINGIYEIAVEKNINLNKEDIHNSLLNAILTNKIDFDLFVDNLNIIQRDLKITNTDIARAVGYDASFLSRIKSKDRKPADCEEFIDKIREYIISLCHNNEKKELISSLFSCSVSDLSDMDKFKNIFTDWVTSEHIKNNTQNVVDFLSKLDNFNLNDYIHTDFSKIKIPTTPVILKSSKTFYGSDGRKKAEGEFLKTTLISKSKEPIFFYSNLPIAKAGEDDVFKEKWILAITMILKKGLHLNIVHNIDRPLEEMLLGIESWLPIYMTGSISPYYFENPPSNLFTGSHCTSGSVALFSECIKNNENNTRFYLTTKKNEVTFEKEKSKYMLSKAKPLMKIFKESDKEDFDEFLKQEENKNTEKVKIDIFKNIDFEINYNNWIMVNKLTSPKIHFVIYNKKLMEAIKEFLLT